MATLAGSEMQVLELLNDARQQLETVANLARTERDNEAAVRAIALKGRISEALIIYQQRRLEVENRRQFIGG